MVIAYLSRLPRKLLRRMAGFLKEEGSYVLPRGDFKPPASLQKLVWPWLQQWLDRIYSRAEGKGWAAGGLQQDDQAAASFLKLLLVLRDVFLQDSAILQLSKCPLPPLPPFTFTFTLTNYFLYS